MPTQRPDDRRTGVAVAAEMARVSSPWKRSTAFEIIEENQQNLHCSKIGRAFCSHAVNQLTINLNINTVVDSRVSAFYVHLLLFVLGI